MILNEVSSPGLDREHTLPWLQLERHWYVNKEGHRTLRGPYGYFRYHEDGKQKKIHLGKTDDPEGKLEERRDIRRS